VDVEFAAAEIADLVPMSVNQSFVCQGFQQGTALIEIVNRLFEFQECLPVFHGFW
jgi:hypothetical protein